MTNPFLRPNVVDFLERVGSTAFETFAASYLLAPSAPQVKVALGAAGLSALKYVALKISVWQAAHPG